MVSVVDLLTEAGVFLVLNRIVEKVDSIGLLVLICGQ